MLSDSPLDDEGWRVSAEPIRDAALRGAVLETVGRIGAVLGADHDDPTVADDVVAAQRHLEDATALLTGTLKTGRAGDRPRGVTRDAVVDLLLDIREIRARRSPRRRSRGRW